MNETIGRPSIFVALGSNLGDSRSILVEAITALRALSRQVMAASSLWTTEPVDCPPGSPDFLNAVVGFVAVTVPDPHALLDVLQSMEREWGRRPKEIMNEPRPLDLDLLAWGDRVVETPRLILPHPRAHRRRFVLGPWSEIAPEFRLPPLGRRIRELLREVEREGP